MITVSRRRAEAFILEHEYCGEIDGGVEDERVWMTCTCGAMIARNHGAVDRRMADGAEVPVDLLLALEFTRRALDE